VKFDIGETLVYPHHGAVTITELETKTVKGEDKRYMTLRVHTSDLIIKLPIDNVELVGVRDVIDAAGVGEVFAVLQNDFVEASGSVHRVAEVVRDLWRREQAQGVSAGEKRLLLKARQVLISELALARSVSDEDASLLLDEVLNAVVV
jgi:CarD family transcriptional regulator